jgi:hypothetical protein
MSGLAVVGRTGIELRVARLARMPPDSERALRRLKSQVQSAWEGLESGGVVALMQSALHTSMPVLPPLRHAQPATLDELLDDLDLALSNHHPEEICVASYTLLSTLVDVVERERGAIHVQALLGALERWPS